MSLAAAQGKCPNDQKILNEELIGGIVEVARRNPQHAADLFGIALGVAVRLAELSDAQIDDLSTTSVALWRARLAPADVRQLAARQPMAAPELEPYRPVVSRSLPACSPSRRSPRAAEGSPRPRSRGSRTRPSS